MSFKFITSDNQSNVYAVTEGGDLLYYRDEARDGTSRWANGGAGQKIGSDWGHFLHVFAGDDGIIYTVAPNGNLLYFRDQARNGTSQWANGGIGQKIGDGWNSFLKIFSGGDGVIYAVASNGDLLFYRDEARNGTPGWSNGGAARKIHEGWDKFLHVFSGGGGIIYAIAENGDLFYFRDKARDGTRKWFRGGKGAKIADGWGLFSTVFSGGDGVIYAIVDGSLLFFKDEARSGKADWAFKGQGQIIGSGWFIAPKEIGTIEGYCTPISVAPGKAIEFKVSAQFNYQVTYLRLKEQADKKIGIAMADASQKTAGVQHTPADPWENGCGWQTSFTLQVPAGWPSGIYAARCADLNGDETYIVFVVKPSAHQRGDFAVLANTNTWNAYNGWGGRSKYSTPPAAQLSFERPNPATAPLDDGQINHLTRSELWILNWLEDAGYKLDLYSDYDFHLGIDGMASYKALILTTHPEYWTLQMLDNLEKYVQQGGKLLYLGGNGVFEKVEFNNEASSLTLLNGDPASDRPKSFLRNLNPPRSERGILGVAFRFDNYMTFAPYRVLESDHRFFVGTGLANGDLIGQTGINGGAASGWEMDTSEAGNAPDGATVSATGPDDRGSAPDNVQVLARGDNPGYGADMICYETGGGGFVFSAGSLTFGGSLVQDAHLQAVIRNILNECLGR
jgi:N,N-dimethylformamidase